jgi:hypothetical protein
MVWETWQLWSRANWEQVGDAVVVMGKTKFMQGQIVERTAEVKLRSR